MPACLPACLPASRRRLTIAAACHPSRSSTSPPPRPPALPALPASPPLQGNLLDDTELVDILAVTKQTAQVGGCGCVCVCVCACVRVG